MRPSLVANHLIYPITSHKPGRTLFAEWSQCTLYRPGIKQEYDSQHVNMGLVSWNNSFLRAWNSTWKTYIGWSVFKPQLTSSRGGNWRCKSMAMCAFLAKRTSFSVSTSTSLFELSVLIEGYELYVWKASDCLQDNFVWLTKSCCTSCLLPFLPMFIMLRPTSCEYRYSVSTSWCTPKISQTDLVYIQYFFWMQPWGLFLPSMSSSPVRILLLCYAQLMSPFSLGRF